MTALSNAAAQFKTALSLHNATIATATTTNGTGVDCGAYEGQMLCILNTSGSSGDTLDVTLECSETQGGTYTAVNVAGAPAAFAQVGATASCQALAFNVDPQKRWIRAVLTSAGSTISFDASVVLTGIKKYN